MDRSFKRLSRGHRYLWGLALSLTILTAVACSSEEPASSPTASATTQPTSTTEPTATAQAAPTSTAQVSDTPTPVLTPTATATAAVQPTSAPSGDDAMVTLGSAGERGEILVGNDGATLYIFDNDTEGVSNCTGGCLASWPPFIAGSDAVAGSGVTATIGTLDLADGTKQVTVNGFPAYYWQGDSAPGDSNGHGVNNVWWVFNPDGTPQRPAKLSVAEDSAHGNILVDGDGLTLYIFDNDTEGMSNCSGGCLAAWPPLLTEYGAVALSGVEAQVGTIETADGSMQVTINGFPAYHWQGDSAPGDTNGHGVNNVWWVFNSNGTPQRAAKVSVGEVPPFGDILVGGNGLTLYLFDNDTAGVSNCSGGCLASWPPLLARYGAVALSDVEGEVGTIVRDDGDTQVTVNGFPVYYWAGDDAPGEASGQGVSNVWWVMGADGEAIRN